MSAAPSLYVRGDSLFHRINPRAKLVLVACVSVAAYVFSHPLYVAVPLAASLLALTWAGSLHKLRRVWFILVMLFLVGFVVWPAYEPAVGPTWVETPLFTLSRHEILFALGRSERIVTFIVAGFAFVTTTSNEEIIAALRGFKLPYAFCFALGTALRLFPTFLGATGTVKQAQEARGLDLSEGGPLQRMRNYIPLLIPVLMTAVRQVNAQSMALEARGFDTGRERTFYGEPAFTGRDWGVVALSLVIVVAAVALSQVGVGML
ncbi:MAG: energy-coupling factor transporter transmembrane protein EcfT [Haloarculaceae archaeon]